MDKPASIILRIDHGQAQNGRIAWLAYQIVGTDGHNMLCENRRAERPKFWKKGRQYRAISEGGQINDIGSENF